MNAYSKIGENEVLVKVGACCISETGRSGKLNSEQASNISRKGDALRKSETAEGDSFAGEIVRTGRAVIDLNAGDLICVSEGAGRGLSEYAVVNAAECLLLNSLPEAASDRLAAAEAGALTGSLLHAYHAIFGDGRGFQPGGAVAVVGASTAGLAAIALARACGAGKIISLEPGEEKRLLAKQMGADYVYNPITLQEQNVILSDLILDITDHAGVTLQVNTGLRGSFAVELPEECLEEHARVVCISDPAELPDADKNDLRQKERRAVIRLMASGRIDMRKSITTRIALSDYRMLTKAGLPDYAGSTVVSQYYESLTAVFGGDSDLVV